MSLIKSFTDTSGNVCPDAYFRVVQINIGAADHTINLTMYAYKDADAFKAGKASLPGGSKNYVISGADFLAIASSAPVGATLYDVLAYASEHYALTCMDTDETTDGVTTKVSFFKGAAQI